MGDGPQHEEGSQQIEIDGLDQDRNLSDPTLASELRDEDDPVKILVQLQRMRKACGQSSRSRASATKGVKNGVKGTMNISRGSYNTTHKAIVGT